jgi:hypothetical protein
MECRFRNIDVLIQECIVHLRALGYSEANVSEHCRKWRDGNNTQFIIARHNDTDHPHIHLVINRIDNDGKRISDKNEKLRSTKVCMELTKKYGLYIAKGKENVKEHRLKEPDKTKYEIYHSLQSAVARSTDWAELIRELKKANISTQFKYKNGTSEVQGVKFVKNGYEFSGSKIDYQLNLNARTQDFQIKQEHANTQNQSSVLETASSIASGLFNIPAVESDHDPEDAEFQKQHSLKKNRNGDDWECNLTHLFQEYIFPKIPQIPQIIFYTKNFL